MSDVSITVPPGLVVPPDFPYEAWTDDLAQDDYMTAFGVEAPSPWNRHYSAEEHGAEHSGECLPE